MKRFLSVFLLTASLLSCNDSNSKYTPLVSRLIRDGKAQLAVGAWSPARASFDEALRIDPQNTEAEYGLVLAEVRHLWSFLDFTAQFLGSGVGFAPKETSGSIDTFIGELIPQFDATLISIIVHTARLRDNPRSGIKLKHYPFHIQGKVYLDFGGEWDSSDAHVLDAIFSAATAAVRLIHSQDYAEGIAAVYADYVSLGQELDVDTISKLLARNLERRSKWLALNPSTGEKQWRESGELLLRAVTGLQRLPSAIQAESDNQADDIFVMEPEKGNDLLLRQPALEARKPARFLWDGSSVSLKKTLERMAENLGAERALRVRLLEDGVLFGVVILDAIRQSMDVAAFAGEFGVEIPEVIGSFLGLPSSSGEGFAVGILGLAGDYVPPGLAEFDLGFFFHHPTDFRALFPVWRVTADGERDGFIFSYECPRIEATGNMSGGGSVRIRLQDSGRSATKGAGNDTVPVLFTTFGGATTDAETILLIEDAVAEGWFSTTFNPIAGAAVTFDSTFQLNGDPLTVTGTYTDMAASPNANVELKWVNNSRKDSVGDLSHFTCDLPAHDGNHFSEQALEMNMAADGLSGNLPYIPFQSPSFNGLLYVNPQELEALSGLENWKATDHAFEGEMAKTDLRVLNVLIQGYGKLIDE